MSDPRCAAAVLALTLTACTVGPDYEPPELQAPPGWATAGEPGVAAEPADVAAWWRRLGDPVLDGLIERAVAQSLDLQLAVERVREARALRAVAAGGRWPEVGAFASYRRSRASNKTDFGEFGVLRDADLIRAGIDASWELDVWGRVTRSIEAADADLGATVEDARGVLVSVVTEIALGYVELRSFQRRHQIATQNVELQRQTLDLVRSRFAAGLISERDVAQAAANLQTTLARLPALEAGARQAEHRLAVLLGRAPGALAGELRAAAPIPVAPVTVAVGVPAETLRRRPDVRRAERVLHAETARIGVVEADRYPRLMLLGTFGFESAQIPDLFDSGAAILSGAAAATWNIFDGGTRSARVEAQESRRDQARLGLESVVLTAFAEVEDAIVAFVREQMRRQALLDAVASARDAVRLAEAEYRQGLADFQSVLDSQRQLASLEDELTQSDAAVASDFVLLYRSLGGGWDSIAWDPAATQS